MNGRFPFLWILSIIFLGLIISINPVECLIADGKPILSQNSAGVAGSPEEPDAFGHALSASDFNGDGFSDLAIGVPHEKIGTSHSGEAAGAVNILYGSEDGLIGDATEPVWNQNSPAIAGSSEYGDNFGRSLASGDFNGDGRGDLAVGVPFEQIGDSSSGELAGAVNVLYGSQGGIRADANEPIWNQNTTGIAGVSEYGDNFGHALAAGDFNRDGFDDLAIGVPSEDIVSKRNAGAVNVLLGGRRL